LKKISVVGFFKSSSSYKILWKHSLSLYLYMRARARVCVCVCVCVDISIYIFYSQASKLSTSRQVLVIRFISWRKRPQTSSPRKWQFA